MDDRLRLRLWLLSELWNEGCLWRHAHDLGADWLEQRSQDGIDLVCLLMRHYGVLESDEDLDRLVDLAKTGVIPGQPGPELGIAV